MDAAEQARFVEFVQASSPHLLKTAWLLTGDPHVAEDLVQEALARVYSKWGSAKKAPWAYTRKVMLNLRTDRWRRTGAEIVTSDIEESATRDAHGTVDARADLVRALRHLPLRERQCVVLRYYADLSEEETANALGVSVGTVKSSASRGLATLRTIVKTDTPSSKGAAS